MKEKIKDKEPTWKEYFYRDDLHPVYPLTKKLCTWVIINMPDFSFTTGWKRRIVNLVLLAFFLYISIMLFYEGITLFGLVLRMILIAVVTSLFYSKTMSYMILKFLETFQKQLKERLK